MAYKDKSKDQQYHRDYFQRVRKDRRAQGSTPLEAKPCDHCGTLFTPSGRGNHRYCEQCRHQRTVATRVCDLCKKTFVLSGQGRFRYCETCREKMRRGEIDGKRNAYWIKDTNRIQSRSTYFRVQRRQKERKARVEAQRKQGIIICGWCERPIPLQTLKEYPDQRYHNRHCFAKDLRERRKLTQFYYHLGKKGNQRQEEIYLETGVRPGTEKRQAHTRHLNEMRKNGKPWGKTGPKKRDAPHERKP